MESLQWDENFTKILRNSDKTDDTPTLSWLSHFIHDGLKHPTPKINP